MRRRSFLRGGLLLSAGLGLAGCGSDPQPTSTGPRPLTTAEAERLAVIRFNGFNVGVRSFTGTFTDGRVQVAMTGWLNLVDHVGYALATPRAIQAGQDAGDAFLVEWTLNQVGRRVPDGPEPLLPVPTDNWQTSTLTASDSFLASGQLILLNLGSDRPENPQLLAQSTARWIRADRLGTVPVDVMSGPSAEGSTAASGLRYWVDAQGTLLRMEAQLGTALWSLIDFADAPDVSIPNPSSAGG